jgi:hypothetical protein
MCSVFVVNLDLGDTAHHLKPIYPPGIDLFHIAQVRWMSRQRESFPGIRQLWRRETGCPKDYFHSGRSYL